MKFKYRLTQADLIEADHQIAYIEKTKKEFNDLFNRVEKPDFAGKQVLDSIYTSMLFEDLKKFISQIEIEDKGMPIKTTLSILDNEYYTLLPSSSNKDLKIALSALCHTIFLRTSDIKTRKINIPDNIISFSVEYLEEENKLV